MLFNLFFTSGSTDLNESGSTSLCISMYMCNLDSSNHDHDSGKPVPEAKIFKDDELKNMIDPILEADDKNKDGFIDYPEFIAAQQAAAAAHAE